VLAKTLEGTSLKPETLEMCAIKKVGDKIVIDWKDDDELAELIKKEKDSHATTTA
jgi:hypothetical protein